MATKTPNEQIYGNNVGLRQPNDPDSGRKSFMDEADYRGLFSPAREQITNATTQSTKNFFNLSDYYWYPEGFTEFLSNSDLFNTIAKGETSITGDLPDSGTGPVGMLVNDVKKSAKKYGKQLSSLKNKFSSIGKTKQTISSIFNSSDEPQNESTPTDILLSSIPYIKITEFQPQQEIGAAVEKMKMIWDTIEAITSSGGGNKANNTLDVITQTFSKDGIKQVIEKVAGDGIFDADEAVVNIMSIPNFFYDNLIGGTYTAQYHVPHIGQEIYMNAMGQTGWESRSMKQAFFGKMIGGLVDKIPGLRNVDIAGKPKFNLEGNNPVPDQVETTFALFNYDLQALVANLKFIHAITAGAFWIQSGFLQLSSNLYDIEVPGRFRHYLCKGDVKVDFAGKVRTLHEHQLHEIKNQMPIITNDEAIKKCPDAFKVTLQFTSLLPNNFNTYLNYITGKNQVSIGQRKDDTTGKIIRTFKETVEEKSTAPKSATD